MTGRGAGLSAVVVAAATTILVAGLVSSARPADPIPPPPARYFNDYAGLLSAADAARLDAKLQAFDEQTSNQVVVAIFAELPSPSLEDFTIRTAQSWRAGREKLDNGVVLFVFVKDRKSRIEVGYGLEGALPDITASHILQEKLAPRFRNGDYAGGLEAAIDAIIAATRGEYKAEPPTAMGWALTVLMLLLFASVFFFVIWIAYKNRKAWATYRGSGWGTGGGWGGGGGWSSGSSGGGWGGGGGGSFGGGGFSGGGGSFGGGGASGSW